MKAVEIKGIVHDFTMPYKGKNSESQDIIIFVPGYVNEFEEKVGFDNHIPIKAFNAKMELLKDIEKGDKVEVSAFLSGRQYQSERGTGYILNLNLRSITKI